MAGKAGPMTRLRALLLVLAGLTVLVALWLWLTLLAPFTYDRPEDLPPVAEGPHRVFVYGTLRFDIVRWAVMGRAGQTRPAVLEGFRREGLDVDRAPGAEVEGEVVEVSAEQLARLDRYERLGLRYERVTVELADGTEAWVYRRLPESASLGPATGWPTSYELRASRITGIPTAVTMISSGAIAVSRARSGCRQTSDQKPSNPTGQRWHKKHQPVLRVDWYARCAPAAAQPTSEDQLREAMLAEHCRSNAELPDGAGAAERNARECCPQVR